MVRNALVTGLRFWPPPRGAYKLQRSAGLLTWTKWGGRGREREGKGRVKGEGERKRGWKKIGDKVGKGETGERRGEKEEGRRKGRVWHLLQLSRSTSDYEQWRIQDLLKGAGVASGRRPRGMEYGERCPLPIGMGSGRGCAPPQKNFEILLLKLRILVYSEYQSYLCISCL